MTGVWAVGAAASTGPPSAKGIHLRHNRSPYQGLRQQYAGVFQDSHDAMRTLMWQKDQKSVCALVLAIVNEAQTA